MKYIKLRIWWSDKTIWEKVLFVIQNIIAFVAIVCSVLMMTGVWDYGMAVSVSCWVAIGILNSVKMWDEHHKLSIVTLGSIALFILWIIAAVLWSD